MTHKLTDADWMLDAVGMVMADGLAFATVLECSSLSGEYQTNRAEAFNAAIWAAIRLKEIAKTNDLVTGLAAQKGKIHGRKG